MTTELRSGSQGTGWFARFGIGVTVVLSTVLALLAVVLVNWLTSRPGVRQRFDLTQAGKNSLATATVGVLERLREQGAKVQVEILYRPDDPFLAAVEAELMSRTEAMLALVEDEAGGAVDVSIMDLSDRDAWQQRALELRIEGFENGLLVSNGELRTFVALVGDIAQINVGDPSRGMAPRVASFTGEAALVEALLDVTRGERLHAYFTFGFGELDVMDDTGDFEGGRLGEVLTREGFRIHRWNFEEDGPLPDDCAVLGVLGPTQAWPAAMFSAVDEYVARGGRAVIAAAPEAGELQRSSLEELLEPRGLQLTAGTLMRFTLDKATGKPFDGVPDCQNLFIHPSDLAQHPMLAPFTNAKRGFAFVRAHQVRVQRQPEDGLAQVVAWAGNRPTPTWLDAPPLDYRYDPATESMDLGRPGVLATVQMAPTFDVVTPLALEAELETRVVALGSSTAFANAAHDVNADLWRAVFNWATEREHRVMISPKDPDLRYLPPEDPDAIVSVVRFAQYWLPLSVLVIGCVVAVLRSRGGPRARGAAAHKEAAA